MEKSTPAPTGPRRVRFIGQGTYVGYFGQRVIKFGPQHVIEVSAEQAEDLLARREDNKPVWEDAGKAPLGPPAPATTSTKPSQADAPSPAKQ